MPSGRSPDRYEAMSAPPFSTNSSIFLGQLFRDGNHVGQHEHAITGEIGLVIDDVKLVGPLLEHAGDAADGRRKPFGRCRAIRRPRASSRRCRRPGEPLGTTALSPPPGRRRTPIRSYTYGIDLAREDGAGPR